MMSEQILDAVKKWIMQAFGGGVLPFGFELPVACKILGDKSRSSLYEKAGLGELDFVKDGSKTIVTADSLIRYLGRMQTAKIKPTPPRKWKAKTPTASPRRRHRQSPDRQQTSIQSG
jgi:hypothetical protein